MIELEHHGLVVIAGQALGIGADAALAVAAQAALNRKLAGREGGRRTGRGARRPARAAHGAAAVALMHALLRHPPLPAAANESRQRPFGRQRLGADLDVPRAAAMTIEARGSGRLTPAGATCWLGRLSPDP